MDIFSTQILAAIKKIRTQKGRPDSDKIFKEIVKESATNFTLEDIQQALQHMVSDGKLINIPHKGLDSYCCRHSVSRVYLWQRYRSSEESYSKWHWFPPFSKHLCGNPQNW